MPKTATPLEFLDALRDAFATRYGHSAYLASGAWDVIVSTYNRLPGDDPPPEPQELPEVP